MESIEESYGCLLVFEIEELKEALFKLMMNMRWSEEGCKEVAKYMHKNTEHDKDLRWGEHITLADASKDYLPLSDYWPEINEKVDNLKHEIRKVQVLLSSIESSYYKTKFSEKDKKVIDNTSMKLQKWVERFPLKIWGLKTHSNFDVFIEMEKECKNIGNDIRKLHMIIGPLLAFIYSSSVLNQIDIQKQNNDYDDMENTEESLEENKVDIFQKSEFTSIEESKRTSEFHEKFQEVNKVELTKEQIKRLRKQSVKPDLYLKEEHKKAFEVGEMRSASHTFQRDSAMNRDFSIFEEENKIDKDSMITVFAATFDDLSNCNVSYKELVDFMYNIRDSNFEWREEIDNYTDKHDLKPSQEYEDERVIPNVQEIESVLIRSKLNKAPQLNSSFRLTIDLKNKKYSKAFLREVKEYQMPKIHSLTINNIDRIGTNDFTDFAGFMRHTMASEFQEFFFKSGQEIALTQFNHYITNILPKVNYQAVFSNFIMTNEDLVNIFTKLENARHLEFDSWGLGMVDENLKINDITKSSLWSITINGKNKKLDEKKILRFLNIISTALSKTLIKDTLKALYLPKIMDSREVSLIFRDKGFTLNRIIDNSTQQLL